jgi:hypothetical protein
VRYRRNWSEVPSASIVPRYWPHPAALATFYGAMLAWKADFSPGWAEVRAEYGQCISFQRVAVYTPPRWPAQEVCPSRCIST